MFELTMHFKHEMIGKHFTETLKNGVVNVDHFAVLTL